MAEVNLQGTAIPAPQYNPSQPVPARPSAKIGDLPAGVTPDVVVIGGGPAGATAATLLALGGKRVWLFERKGFPRFHIGESLIPETYWTLKRTGMLDRLRTSGFVKKYSVQFVNEFGKLSEPFYFDQHRPHECSQTWQVLRSEFDRMQLENAAEKGVRVFEGLRVTEVLFEGDRAVGVRLRDDDGKTAEVRAAVTVDAGGQSCMLATKFGLTEVDPRLRNGAVWTYWKGAYRDAGRDEGCTVVLQTKGKQGWFWYIPLHDDILSVGVVRPFAQMFDGRTAEQIYKDELANCPAVAKRVGQGVRVADYLSTKDFSYRARKCAGDGWVLCGDAYGFLDPLYSSGVLLALKGAEMASDAILEGFRTGDLSARQLGSWQREFDRGMDRMRRLVLEFYDGLSFGRLIRRRPELKGLVTDILIGALFKDDVDAVFEEIDRMRNEAAATGADLMAEPVVAGAA